jgi:hypothetical protein
MFSHSTIVYSLYRVVFNKKWLGPLHFFFRWGAHTNKATIAIRKKFKNSRYDGVGERAYFVSSRLS